MAVILLIDADQQLRRTFRRVLESAKHEMVEAAEGRAGLKLLHEHSPALVITDVIMPGQEGIETTVELRRRVPETKIIAISGSDVAGRLDFLHEARLLGADLTLRKPIRAADLVSAVSTLLGAADRP